MSLEEIEASGPFIYDLKVHGHFFNVDLARYAEATLPEGEANDFALALEGARIADEDGETDESGSLAMTLNFSDFSQYVTENWSGSETIDPRFTHYPDVQDYAISVNDASMPGDLDWEGNAYLMWVNLDSLTETPEGFAIRLNQERDARAAAE